MKQVPRDHNAISDTDIGDAYLYLLGRLLVLRQEHLDFRDNGFKWNEVIHHEPGGVAWANPNLDVAYSEAWIGIDEHSCTIVEVPKIEGRLPPVTTSSARSSISLTGTPALRDSSAAAIPWTSALNLLP